MAVHVINEANRCLQCKKPSCVEGCPVHTPIPQIIEEFKQHKLMEAGAQLFANNPLSLVCAIVCDHEAQCSGHCVLAKKDAPISFFSIERFISDAYLDRMRPQLAERKGKKAAVIGAGPSGMTVALVLAQAGYDITVFDDNSHVGGMLYYGIPEFRLSKSVLARYRKVMDAFGIQFRPNTVLGEALDIEDLFRDGYEAIFVGTGVWRPKNLGIEGESLANVHFGISYLANPDAYALGDKVAIIGMGNVAMDVARTALRHGAQEVTLYGRSKRVAASENEVAYAKLDGAEFVHGMAIEKVLPEGPVFKVAIFDEDDEVVGYEEDLACIQADSTILAVSQGPKNKLINSSRCLEGDERGLLVTDENCMTTCAGVFAAGDVVHGSNTVVAAVDEAKRAAAAMIKFMDR